MDTGAEIDGVGENLVPHLELHGGVVTQLPVPQLITWSDESVTRESCATIKMHFEITGSDMGKDLSFYIVP